MKRHVLLAVAALTVSLGAGPANAQKAKGLDVSGFSFVSGPKGDRPHVPGLNATLLLTDEQKEKLVLARQETLGSEAVVSAGRKVKGDPNATEADRQAARKTAEEAQGQYDRRLADILTPKQKELLLSFQVLYSQARDAATAEFGPKLVAAKGNAEETARLRNEARQAVMTDFTRRVNEVLTPEQRTAFERAAAIEKQREASKPKNKG